MKTRANQPLTMAEECREAGNYIDSKEFYSQALSDLIDVYKSTDQDAERKSRLLEL